MFRQSAEKSIIKDRDAAQANVDRLASRAVDAEQAVTARRSAAQQLAFDNADDGVLGKAEAALRSALDRQAVINAASAEAGKLLALLESQLAELLDKKQRASTSVELLAMADDLIQACAGIDVSMSALANTATAAAVFLSEARGLEVFASASLIQVPQAVDYTVSLLRERSRLVLAGEAPPTLPEAEQPFVPTIPAKPVTRRLFSLKPVSWTDDNGLRVAQRWTDVDLPLACADRAIAARVCVEMNDPARSRQTVGQWPGHPNPANCCNLDDPDAPANGAAAVDGPQHEPDEVHSAFQPLDRGQPYPLRIAR